MPVVFIDPPRALHAHQKANTEAHDVVPAGGTTDLPVPGIVETAAANRDFKPGFSTAMMLKDLRLAQQAAQGVAAATPMGAEAAALYTLFSNAGNDDLDYSAIVKMIAGE